MPRYVTLLFLLLLTATQLPALATGGRPATLRQATSTPAWDRVDTGPFSVALPPGWTYEPKHGVDSFVGEFVGPDMHLTFDYGRYWLELPAPGSPGYDVLHEDVDFRPADIWVARAAPADVTALYVDYVVDPEPAGLAPTRLSLVGSQLTPEQQDVALAIMRTVRFKRLIPAQGRWEVVAEIPNATLLDLELLDDDALRVAGGYYEAGTTTPVGAVYERHDGAWQRQAITGTNVIGGLSGDWAVEWGGRRVFHLDADGAWHTAVSDSPGLLFDLEEINQDVWAVGIRALLHFDGAVWTTVPDNGDGISIDLVSEAEGWIAGARSFNQRIGGVWQAVPWPAPADGSVPADGSLLGVDTLSPREAWFAGGLDGSIGGLLHWHDGAWNYIGDLAPHDLWGVDLISPAEGWAVGGSLSYTDACEVLRFVEGSWQPQADVCIGHLHAVKVAADGTTWAAGTRRTADNVEIGLVLRYAAPVVTLTVTPMPTVAATPSPIATLAPTLPRLYLPVASKVH